MSLIINVYTKSKTKNFSAVTSGDSLYCCIADDNKNILDYFFLPFFVLDDLKALSFTAIAKYVKDNRSSTPFPPAVNTGTKSESCVIADSVGVVDSVGDSLLMSADVTPVCPCFPETESSASSDVVESVSGGNPIVCKNYGKTYIRSYPNHPKYENLPLAHDDDLYNWGLGI